MGKKKKNPLKQPGEHQIRLAGITSKLPHRSFDASTIVQRQQREDTQNNHRQNDTSLHERRKNSELGDTVNLKSEPHSAGEAIPSAQTGCARRSTPCSARRRGCQSSCRCCWAAELIRRRCRKWKKEGEIRCGSCRITSVLIVSHQSCTERTTAM